MQKKTYFQSVADYSPPLTTSQRRTIHKCERVSRVAPSLRPGAVPSSIVISSPAAAGPYETLVAKISASFHPRGWEVVIGPELRSLIKIRSAIQWPSIAAISGRVSVILQNGSQGSGRGGEVLAVVTVVQVSANGQIGNVGDAQMQSAASVVDITTLRQLDPSLVELRTERQFIRFRV